MAESLGGRWRADAADALIDEVEREGLALETQLRDSRRSTFHWVLLPERLSLEESRDGLAALRAAGIAVDELIVNRVTPAPQGRCALCEGRRKAEAEVIRQARRELPPGPLRLLPALEIEPRGLSALAKFGRTAARPAAAPPKPRARRTKSASKAVSPLPLELPPTLRLLLFGGKGGVGKSSCAAAVALRLAGELPARRVLILSTDPAHSLADVLGAPRTSRRASSMPTGPLLESGSDTGARSTSCSTRCEAAPASTPPTTARSSRT